MNSKRMKSLKFLKNITLGFTILLISYISVHAGFGVSPTNINSEYLKPGASFTQEFTLSRSDATSDMNVQIVPDLGGIDSWFTFDPGKTFVFKKGQTTQKFKVIVKVPDDAQYTNYKGVIRVNALPSEQAVGGVSITQGVRLDAGLTVTEQDYRALSILSIKALDSQTGALNVLPESKEHEYLVYEEQDTNSKVIYTASEGEQFSVITETEEWYQVSLKDGSTGWLQKAIVKNTLTEEK